MAANNSPAPPAQTLTVTSNTSAAQGFNANAFPQWIRLNGVTTPPSISGDTLTSPTITVKIDPSAYNAGGTTAKGTIQVQSGGTFLSVPVSVTVTPTCTLAATPSTVNLSFAQASQIVAITGPTSDLITVAPVYGTNNPVGWFNLSTTSLLTAQSLTVSLASTSLLTGTTGAILFTEYGKNNSISVPVIFTSTAGNGVFTAKPSSIGLTFASSTSSPETPFVTITGPPAQVGMSVNLGSGPVGWLNVTQQSAITPITFGIEVNPVSLPPGTTIGSVTVSQNNTNNFVTIPVSATVGTATFSYSPNPFNITVSGGSGSVVNQNLTITGPNNSSIIATAQVANGVRQWLTVNGNTTTAGTLTNSMLQLIVTINPVTLASNQIYTGNIVVTQGNSTVLNIPVTISTFPLSHLHDFVGNGLSGALLYVPISGTAYTALSNGNGTYQYVYNLYTPGFDTLRTGDFNGDGKSDLILYNSQNAAAYIGLSNGDGTFAFQSLFWPPNFDFVEAGDLNNDSKTDIALYHSSDGTLYTGISNGTGGFTYKYTLISSGFTFVRLADFNGDGKADLFAYNRISGAAFLGIGDGTGGFVFYPLFISPGYDLIDIGDLNGDGRADIILYNSTTGNAATGISAGLGSFIFTPLIFSPGFTSVRLADYTGSGYASVTLYNQTSGAAYFGTGTGHGTFSFQSLFWSPGYDYVQPEDVNGDGKWDIILYDSTTGTEYTGIGNGDGTFSFTYQYWGIGKMIAR